MFKRIKRHPWISLIATLALLCLLEFATNPLRWPDDWLQAWLYYKVPVGSTEAQFLKVAKNSGWRINGDPWNGSQVNLKTWGGFDPNKPTSLNGARFYFVHLGCFYTILREDVQAFWSFDDQGRVIAVRFRREIDAP